MGVKGLLSFATSSFTNSSTLSAFQEEAFEYRRSCGRNPLLVCDGNSLLRKFQPLSVPTIYGGQWTEYEAAVADFVTKFKNLGIELVFVFDGIVDENKKDVWFLRRKENHGKNCKVFDSIRESGREPDRRQFFTLPAMSQYATMLILKSLGVEVMCSFTDGDTEIAFQARERGAFGVLSADSDVLIYDSGCPIFTIFDLDLTHMTTICISPCRLRRHLNLNQTDMPLLACLSGNDHVPPWMLEAFHARIFRHIQGFPKQQRVIVNVAEYIEHCKRRNMNLTDIYHEAFPDGSRDHMRVVLQSFASYILPGEEISPWLTSTPPYGEIGNMHACCPWRTVVFPSGLLRTIDWKSQFVAKDLLKRLLDHHADADIPPQIYTILFHHHYKCSSSLEDYKQTDIPSTKLLYSNIRFQIYSILLNHEDLRRNKVSVVEWVGDKSVESGVSEEKVIVGLFKSYGIHISPNLYDLWMPRPDRGVFDFKLRTFFSACCCDDLIPMIQEYLAIPPHLTVLCLLLHFLVYKNKAAPVFNKREVDAFIAQAISPIRQNIEEVKTVRVMPRPRAVNLASVFVRGIDALGIANAACGRPLPQGAFSPVHIFNGVLFMKKYMQTVHNIGLEILLDQKSELKGLFFRLKNLILTTTS